MELNDDAINTLQVRAEMPRTRFVATDQALLLMLDRRVFLWIVVTRR